MIGQVIQPGETALLFTKKKIADKRNLPYAVVDIDDTYAADGSVSKSANFNIHFPTLRSTKMRILKTKDCLPIRR